MPRRRWTLCLVAALTLLAGCESLLTRPIRYGRVVVFVQSRDSVPLPGLFTILYTGARPMGYGRTDAMGRVEFSFVPPAQYGVWVDLPDTIADISEFEGGRPRFYIDGLDITAGTDTTLRFTFVTRGRGAAEALVLDAVGDPLVNLRVFFYTPNGVVGSTTTGADGIARYEPFPFGQAGAYVVPPDSLGVPNSPAIFRDGMVVDGFTVPRVEFRIPTCFGQGRVRVLDDFDAPVPGMDVNLYDSQAIRRTRPTDAAGVVQLPRIGCGNYGVALGMARSGYENVPGRGFGFVDGLAVRPDTSFDVTLRMRRLP